MQFIADEKRATVAVSRAQHILYIFGNWKMLSRSGFWKKILPGMGESWPFVNQDLITINQDICGIQQVIFLYLLKILLKQNFSGKSCGKVGAMETKRGRRR